MSPRHAAQVGSRQDWKPAESASPLSRSHSSARLRKGWIMDTYLIRKPTVPRR